MCCHIKHLPISFNDTVTIYNNGLSTNFGVDNVTSYKSGESGVSSPTPPPPPMLDPK